MSVHWVYRCFDDSGRLIYVGCTKDLAKRLTAHRRKTWWAPQVARVAAKVYPSRDVAGAIEREAIATESPRWNIVGRWASNWSWSIDDFRDYITAMTAPGRPITIDTTMRLKRAQQLMSERFPERAA